MVAANWRGCDVALRVETLAELPFIGDKVVCLSLERDRLCQSSVNQHSKMAMAI
jgi:hypothetical protein